MRRRGGSVLVVAFAAATSLLASAPEAVEIALPPPPPPIPAPPPTPLAPDNTTRRAWPWATALGGDQRLGGAIAWGATEIPMIIVMIALVSQWARSDERDARRSDRAGDRENDEELDAYNRMLAGLAERDRASASRPVDGVTAESANDPDGPVR